MKKKVRRCKHCGLPIRWVQNVAGNWIPYQPRKNQIHWEVCKGEPEKDTPLALKARIAELETELFKARHARRDFQREVPSHTIYATVQNLQLINTAKAWHRAYEKGSGRTEFHKKRVLAAIARFIDAEQRDKSKARSG